MRNFKVWSRMATLLKHTQDGVHRFLCKLPQCPCFAGHMANNSWSSFTGSNQSMDVNMTWVFEWRLWTFFCMMYKALWARHKEYWIFFAPVRLGWLVQPFDCLLDMQQKWCWWIRLCKNLLDLWITVHSHYVISSSDVLKMYSIVKLLMKSKEYQYEYWQTLS